MLNDPNQMPEFKTAKERFMLPKRKSILVKNRTSIARKGKAAIVNMRQKPTSKHKQPSIYVDTEVEKRRN